MSGCNPSQNFRSFYLALVVLLLISMIIAACSLTAAPESKDEPSGQEEEGYNLAAQEQALEAGDEGSGIGSSDSGEDVPPVWFHCPADPIKVSMFVHHTWNFSPNRETEQMSVDGRTGALASCTLTVDGSQVNMGDCLIPITNSGYVKTDDGMCDVTTSGFARISLEEGFCRDGVITLTLTENLDTEEGYEGAMNCPNTSQPYIPFFPPSITTREYPLQTGGMSATESMDPDLTNQFRYSKEWTLISDAFPYPEEND